MALQNARRQCRFMNVVRQDPCAPLLHPVGGGSVTDREQRTAANLQQRCRCGVTHPRPRFARCRKKRRREGGKAGRFFNVFPRNTLAVWSRLDSLTQSAAVCNMPTATGTKTIRLSRSRLSAAVPILERLGLDSRAAIELFLAQVVSRKAIPFAVALPDSEYAATEYGLTAADIAGAGKRMRRSAEAARRSGEVRPVSGVDSLRE